MKKLYFINDWYQRLPWYGKVLSVLPIVLLYSFIWDIWDKSDTTEMLKKIVLVLGIILYNLAIAYQVFISRVKNAFYYQRAGFKLRVNGKAVDFNPKFISQISYDDRNILQIRRINRVDSFDLSKIRNKDRERVLAYIKEIVPHEVVYQEEPIVI